MEVKTEDTEQPLKIARLSVLEDLFSGDQQWETSSMTGLISIKKMVVSRQFWLQTSHSPQQNEAADLDCRGEVALSLCSSTSHLVVGIFLSPK